MKYKSQLKVQELIIEIMDLHKALRKYGGHLKWCNVQHHFHSHSGCSCGFDEALNGKEVVDKSSGA